ncbi:hypothetical protein V491_04246 [Pseudogymnoascus sp. VKM F-3775]|nr:hypothetical protein V491_04246 [Pseudogymnoascus sp. VKM F-3775]
MMFSNAKLLTLTLTLIGCVAASPVELHKRAQNVIIGYRTAQAKKYNDAGTLTDDPNRIGTQIGKGVYTTPGRGEWQGSPNDWFCVILADSAAIDRVSKAWVPKQYDGSELWFKSDTVIDGYIKQLESSWDPAATLRMSIIDGKGYDDVQMVIPPGLLNSNGGGMSITAFCKENINDIPNQRVNYDDWNNNIKGNR